jgi:hypothetical protein
MSLDEKKRIVDAIVAKLEEELGVAKASALAAHNEATHEEAKPENKYDTRGLEASYLAGAQARRAAELVETIREFRAIEWREGVTERGAAAFDLVELFQDGRPVHCFLTKRGGGFTVDVEGTKVQVVSVASPLGQALVGRRVDEEFELALANGARREYEVFRIS